MKQLKFNQRKVVHYTLLTSIIILQLIAIITWYNDLKLSKAFDVIANAGKMNFINSSLVKTQNYFNDYITNKDEDALKNYSSSLNQVINMMDSLSLMSNDKEKTSIFRKRRKIISQAKLIKSSIDSIIEHHINSQNKFINSFKFKEFESKSILDDIKTNSFVKVNKLKSKGLFPRIADAIANRPNVQKEYVNTMVTMQYKDKVITGNVENQIKNAVSITNDYYANEFEKLKKSFSILRINDIKLMELNNQLFDLSQLVMSNYSKDNHLFQPNNFQTLENQYKTNKVIKNFSLVFLIILMLIISVMLFNFTRIAFEYEKRLTLAQERIQQSLNFKNRITGMISHEIRSPLNVLSIYSKKASIITKEPELKKTFKAIEFTTNSLLLLSNQILEFTRDENHKISLNTKKTNLKDEINQITAAMLSLVEAKGNILKLTSNLKKEDIVYTDVAKIHQLFYNLIGNANKFTEKGLIKINLNLESISDYEMNLKVAISDNGIGIAENDLENIFESYYQGTVSEKVNNLGVGLGLNICKEIIDLFDGEITIESKPGEGTKVLFNLILTKV